MRRTLPIKSEKAARRIKGEPGVDETKLDKVVMDAIYETRWKTMYHAECFVGLDTEFMAAGANLGNGIIRFCCHFYVLLLKNCIGSRNIRGMIPGAVWARPRMRCSIRAI